MFCWIILYILSVLEPINAQMEGAGFAPDATPPFAVTVYPNVGHVTEKAPDLSLMLENIETEMSKYKGRPIPPELSGMFEKKTQEDDMLQDCMQDFTECLRAHKAYPFCGKGRNGEFKHFESICELTYDNCKQRMSYWHLSSDKFCPDDSTKKDKNILSTQKGI